MQPPLESTTPQPSLYQTLFPHPTGANGYEDLVQACDTVRQSTSFTLFDSDRLQPSLAQILIALETIDVKRVLELCRTGLGKPILSPHAESVETATFPEFKPLRTIGRLLARLITAEFARGDMQSAIKWIDLSLRFSAGMRMRSEGLILDRAVELIDALSKHNCLELLHVIRNRLALPNLNAEVVKEQYAHAKRVFTRSKESPGALKEILGDTEAYNWAEKALFEQLRMDHDVIRKSADQALDHLDSLMEQALKNAGLPPWQRTKTSLPPELSNETAFLIRVNILDSEMQFSISDQIDARLRLLATRALLRSYRWEHDHTPNTLAVFQEKSLIEDPFSGEPLQYRSKDDEIELFSIGPHRFDENGAPMKERAPLYLPRRD